MPYELIGCIDVDNLDTQIKGERLHYLFGLIQPQQPVIDEDAG